MDRGLMFGAVGFATAFAAERLFAGLKDDIARYDRLREMSGQPSLAKELLSAFVGLIAGRAASGETGVGRLVDGIIDDVVRYARLKSM